MTARAILFGRLNDTCLALKFPGLENKRNNYLKTPRHSCHGSKAIGRIIVPAGIFASGKIIEV